VPLGHLAHSYFHPVNLLVRFIVEAYMIFFRYIFSPFLTGLAAFSFALLATSENGDTTIAKILFAAMVWIVTESAHYSILCKKDYGHYKFYKI